MPLKIITVVFALGLLSACSDFQNNQTLPSEQGEGVTVIPRPTTDRDENEETEFCQSKDVIESWPEPVTQPVFAQQLNNLSGVSRDRVVIQEIINGHGPGAKGNLSTLKITSDSTVLELCVFNDYLTLFRQDEPLRFPLGMTALAEFIGRSEWTLPTHKLVDLIYKASVTKLEPQPIAPGPHMTTTATIIDHSEMVNAKITDPITELLAGHKKDVVISNRLVSRPGKIAIYGWHRLNGQPIQPLSTIHHKDYADYSHGIRFVFKKALLNGVVTDLSYVLGKSDLAGMISHEGTLHSNLIQKYY